MILKNPDYAILTKLGKSTRFCPAYVELPLLTSKTLTASRKTSIKLRPDQLDIYNTVKDQTSFLIEAKTSFGKTVLAIALHQAWGGSTLIAVHTLNMAKQFTEEFENFANITPTMYCNGKHDISDVTVTTFTTLRKMYKDKNWVFDNLIIDEADMFFSRKSIQALYDITTIRKIGLTGTIGVSYDQCNKTENGILPLFYDNYVKAKFDESKNPLKNIYKHWYAKKYYEDGDIVKPYESWHKFRIHLDKDIQRKKEQIKYIQEKHNNEPTLVLFDRVADVDAFYKAGLKRQLTCYKNHGQLKTKDRELMLNNFKKTGGVLFAQTTTLNRGYNNVELSKVFIMYPVRKENTMQQIIGRVMRYIKNKESAVYLWIDSELEFQFRRNKITIKKHFGLDILD